MPTGVQIYFSRHVIPTTNRELPDTTISITTANQNTSDFWNGIKFPDNCDILLSYAQPENQDLIAVNIKSVRLNIFSTDTFHRNNSFSTLSELAKKPFILLKALADKDEKTNTIEIQNLITRNKQYITVSGSVVFDNSYSAIEACQLDRGYLLASPLIIEGNTLLKARLREDYGIFVNIYAIYKKQNRSSKKIKAVIDSIKRCLEKNIARLTLNSECP